MGWHKYWKRIPEYGVEKKLKLKQMWKDKFFMPHLRMG